MKFSFSPEQDEFRSNLRRFLAERSPTKEVRRLMETDAGWERDSWQKLNAELGLTAVRIPEAYGGHGFGFGEHCIVLEEMGRALLCAPYFATTVLAAGAILNAGTRSDHEALLPGIAEGDTIATLASTEDNGRWDGAATTLTATPSGGAYKLNGHKSYVLDGTTADTIIVLGRAPGSTGDTGLSFFVVKGDAAGLGRRALKTMDPTRKMARLTFDGVDATLLGQPGAAAAPFAKTMVEASVCLANEMVGGAERLREDALAYAKLRVQFGRQIGSFQSMKHKHADMLLDVEMAKSAAYYAAAALDEGDADVMAMASLAKAGASDTYLQTGIHAIQIHGGIGFTWDNDTHLWFKRAKSSEVLFGDTHHHRELMMRHWGGSGMSEMTETSVREEVRAWLEANWNPERGLIEWRNMLVDSGWGAPHWPTAWHGRDLPVGFVAVVEEEFKRIGAIGVAKVGIRVLAAATILSHGNDYQKEKFLRRSLTGEDAWCQLFSEPGSGSDAAGAVTRADLKGNQWIVNGQKVWTSGAQKADYGLLLARTDWDVPKHAGLSYFIIDMHQPGITVQPLKQMNGHATFNQVFMTDAVVPPENLMGRVGQGWAVTTTTLMHERRGADGLRTWAMGSDKPGRAYAEEREEIAVSLAPYKWYPNRAGRLDLIMQRAEETGHIDDPVTRQEIAKLLIMSKSAEWTARRARARQEQGRPQGPEGSLGKLASSHIARAAARVHTLMTGANALLTGEDGDLNGTIAEILVSVPATSIAGGTDEIQRNIISERVLEMPKEAREDTGRPFRDVPRNIVN